MLCIEHNLWTVTYVTEYQEFWVYNRMTTIFHKCNIEFSMIGSSLGVDTSNEKVEHEEKGALQAGLPRYKTTKEKF